ncbi:MAG: amidohydrolase family protein [Bacteroidota bacterium]
MKSLYIYLLLLLPLVTLAQSVPQPAPEQSQPIMLLGATIHLGNGEVLEQADILLEDGKIVEIGRITRAYKNARSIDCSGKHIYPGMILIGSSLGLVEIGAVRPTRDQSEVGALNANARALIAYNTDSRVTPTVRSNGILMAQIAPSSGLFSGTSSVMQLDAWNYEDAAILADDGVYLNWPRMSISNSSYAAPRAEQEKRIKSSLERIYQSFRDAAAYKLALENDKLRASDLHLEALVPVLSKERKLYIRASTEKQILGAVALAQEFDLDIVIFGGKEAHLQAELLAEYEIPVVITKLHDLPRMTDDDIDAVYSLPAKLQEAGVLFALTMTSNWDCRNLPFQAGTAAAYGLTQEEALAAVTANPAKILGIEEQCGTLAVGKDASLIVSEGDILDMRSSNVIHAFIQGREINLGNKQKDLYEKFKTRY